MALETALIVPFFPGKGNDEEEAQALNLSLVTCVDALWVSVLVFPKKIEKFQLNLPVLVSDPQHQVNWINFQAFVRPLKKSLVTSAHFQR